MTEPNVKRRRPANPDADQTPSPTPDTPKIGRLSLSRREGEGFKIGDNVYVEIAELRGQVVQLRIHAPRDVAVERFERVHGDDYLENAL